MKDSKQKSYIGFCIAIFLFGTIGIVRRLIPYSSGLLACVRGIIGALFLFLIVKLRGGRVRHHIGAKKFWLLVLGGAFLGFNWVFLFEAYNRTTVATATLCYYMQPTILILTSPLFFREKLTPKRLICAAVSILGMVAVSGVVNGFGDGGIGASGIEIGAGVSGIAGLGASDMSGIICGLIAACLYASLAILNKKVQLEDSFEKAIIEILSASIILIPYLLVTEDFSQLEFTPKAIILTIVLSIVHTAVAFGLWFACIEKLNSQSAAILGYMDPIIAMILGAVILKEKMTVLGLLGAVLIIGAALVSELQFPRKGARRQSLDSSKQ